MLIDFFYNGENRGALSEKKREYYYNYLVQHGCHVAYDPVDRRIDMTGPLFSAVTQTLYQDNITPTSFHYRAFHIVKEKLMSNEDSVNDPFIINLSFERKGVLETSFIRIDCCGKQAWVVAKGLSSSISSLHSIINIKRRWNSLHSPLMDVHCIFPETMDEEEVEAQLEQLAFFLFVSIYTIHRDR